MAEYEMNDHDRAELVINFFKRYGLWIVLVLVIFAVALGFSSFWDSHEQTRDAAASNAYQALLGSIQNNAKPEVISAAATQLSQDYPGTVYASLAQLNLAQLMINQNNLSGAETTLRHDLSHNAHNDLQPIISLRLARVLLAENKSQEVVKLLKHPPRGYEAAYGLLTGDAQLQLKDIKAAQASYQSALTAAGNNPVESQLLTERLNNLSAM